MKMWSKMKYPDFVPESNDWSRSRMIRRWTATERYNEIEMLHDILPATSKTRWCYS
jgi:hypothetical protein